MCVCVGVCVCACVCACVRACILRDLFPDFLLYFHLLSPTRRSFDTSGREQIYVTAPGAY